MPVNLKGRNFLTLRDFTPEEIRYMLDLSHELKTKKRLGIRNKLLEGKNIVKEIGVPNKLVNIVVK